MKIKVEFFLLLHLEKPIKLLKRAVPVSKPETPLATKKETPVVVRETGIKNLADIASLAREENERLLAFGVEHYIRPIDLKDGLIKCVLSPDAARDFGSRLTQFLSRKTGINWIIQTQVSGGGQTLFERKEAEQNALLTHLKQVPPVSTILSAFPGAKVEKIRTLSSTEAESDPVESNTDLDE